MKNKGIIAAFTVSFCVMILMFSGCEVLMGGLPENEKPGVYRIVSGGEKEWVMIAGEVNLSNCLAQIQKEALSGSMVDKYEIVLMKNEEIAPKMISPMKTDYTYLGGGTSKTSFASKEITLKALNGKITIKQRPKKITDDNIPLFVIGTYNEERGSSEQGEVTIIVGPNITIEGSADNPWPLIHVVAGGNLIIEEGAAIKNNARVPTGTGSVGGGAIEVFNGGKVVMNGGTISDNSITSSAHEALGGGGILVSVGGKFTMNGGTITKNSVSNSYNQGTAVGGGIFGFECSLTLNGGTISENNVVSSSGSVYGGGIYLDDKSIPEWKAGSITGNTLSSGGTDPAVSRIKGSGIFVATTGTAFTAPAGLVIENNNPADTQCGSHEAGGGTPISAAEITAFTLSGVSGTITGTDISVILPAGTPLTNLAPIITLSEGATVSPASGTERNFTIPLSYTVTAAGGTPTKIYMVTVITPGVADIISFSVDVEGENVEIDHDTGTDTGSIDVVVPAATGLTSITPTITLLPGAAVVPPSGTLQDFTNSVTTPINYTVTPATGTAKTYAVTVRHPSTAADITAFTLAGASGTITDTAISVTVPYGTVLTSLTPTITVSDHATVDPESGEAQNFTTPVTYTVTAENGTTQKTYTVTVTVAPNPAANITGFSVDVAEEDIVIDQVAGTISVTVPAGTDVTALVPTITLSPGATVDPELEEEQDFTSPVTYTVTAEDEETTKTYTVTVTVASPPP
ncbi:MAG: DUF5018 domain-containing protein [Treponema sp.]|jgi:hypothetical protein|nr:DUF5018 domain-containing protein [Treponema sp.]